MYAIYNLNTFDKNEGNRHLMLRGDTSLIWYEAETFKKDLIKKYVSSFWDLDSGFQTFPAGSGEEISRRIRMLGQK